MWIYDKIHHEINQFCSNKTLQEVYVDDFAVIDDTLQIALQEDCDRHAEGIVIVAIRVTKPHIPRSVRDNFEAMEEQRTAALVAEKTREVVRRHVETEHMKAIAIAEREAQESSIRSRTHSEKLKTEADVKHYEALQKTESEYYAVKREAEANNLLLTESYLRLQEVRVWQHNTKAYFGDRIPSIVGLSPITPIDPATVTAKHFTRGS